MTPLEAAIESRDARMVQLLLDYGVDMGSFRLNMKRQRRAQRQPMRSIVQAVEAGQGALAQACLQGVPDVVVQLLDHGADADLIPLLVRWRGLLKRSSARTETSH